MGGSSPAVGFGDPATRKATVARVSPRSVRIGIGGRSTASTLVPGVDPQTTQAPPGERLTVGAVILSHNRERALGIVLDRLDRAAIDQVIVVDAGSSDATAETARVRVEVQVIEAGDVGIAGRNIGAAAVGTDLLRHAR